ncbi:hypothetical protein QFZ22_002979 [Streptomyces canus]|uniref:DUF4236 domain-containing protein n=1 Tax=Streptomyces canus TaxID=58343 RepID=A0AAW8FA61_9ACTN|nr:hypothetical protein [Streptomyces canus]
MGLTFRKSFRILPGVRLNINRHSWSITTGGDKHGPRHTHTAARDVVRHRWTCPDLSDGAAPVPPSATEAPSGPRRSLTRMHSPECAISYLR